MAANELTFTPDYSSGADQMPWSSNQALPLSVETRFRVVWGLRPKRMMAQMRYRWVQVPLEQVAYDLPPNFGWRSMALPLIPTFPLSVFGPV